jgi:hypothetical protein
MKSLSVLAFLCVLYCAAAPAAAQTAPKILSFQTMYGVDGPFLQSKHHPIRGVRGDELPWEIESADGSVDTEGHVVIHVRGLVFKDDPSVPVNLRGKNDADEFRALVSCITEVSEDDVKRTRTLTQGFPATQQGDADIDATIELPNPCVAPIVFILPGDERLWFAVTGFEAEE